MSQTNPQVAFDQVMQVGECPLWHPTEAAIYWVDIEGKAIHRLHPATSAHQVWPMPTEPATIARAASGGLIVALRSGFSHLDTVTGALTQIVAAPYDTTTTRFNDGRCDADGRFWVGTIYEPRDQQASEMYYLQRGQLHKVWSGGTTVSNGLAFSPDNATLYHADTTAHVVRRHALNLSNASVGPAQVVRQFSMDKANNYGGRPDGAAVDSEGAYWCAMFEGARLLKMSPSGEILQEISLPVRCPTMLAFGGDDLRTLYITSAGKRPAAELDHYPLSGRLLSMRVETAGRIEHAYLD